MPDAQTAFGLPGGVGEKMTRRMLPAAPVGSSVTMNVPIAFEGAPGGGFVATMLIEPIAVPPWGRLAGSTAPLNVKVKVELMKTPVGQIGGVIGVPPMLCQSGVVTPWTVIDESVSVPEPPPPPPPPPPPLPPPQPVSPTEAQTTKASNSSLERDNLMGQSLLF